MKSKAILLTGLILSGFIVPANSITEVKALDVDDVSSISKNDLGRNSSMFDEDNNGNNKDRGNYPLPIDHPLADNEVIIGKPIDKDKINGDTLILVPVKRNTDGKILGYDRFKIDGRFVSSLLDSTKGYSVVPAGVNVSTSWEGVSTYLPQKNSTDNNGNVGTVRFPKFKYNDSTNTIDIYDNKDNLMQDGYVVYHLQYSSIQVNYFLEDTKEKIATKTVQVPVEEGFQFNPLHKVLETPHPGYLNYLDYDKPNSDGSLLTFDYLYGRFDWKNKNPEDAVFNVYLKKAKPATVDVTYYLNGRQLHRVTKDVEVNKYYPNGQSEFAAKQLDEVKDLSVDTEKSVIRTKNPNYSFDKPLFENAEALTNIKNSLLNESFNDGTNPLKSSTSLLWAYVAMSGAGEKFRYMALSDGFSGGTYESKLYLKSDSHTVNDLTISTNLGDKVIKDVFGEIGTTITVDVPKVDGYTPDKTTIKAKVNGNGTITTDEKVVYSKIETPKPDPEPIEQNEFDGFIGTMNNTVKLYELSDNKLVASPLRSLSKFSDWKADKTLKFENEVYYRVSTNEWAKASDVYRYKYSNGIVSTTEHNETKMFSSNLEQSNRFLANDTKWKYDRIAYLGSDEIKHFRVSTNEFVHHEHVTK
ncbi:hypothetical protein [Companilactobacillus ginsenosidimutans]|uniref:Surface layer protein A domain-containing protein n=1 Tax=Companilactobacillus ginsenosidimutans TaxID=1007676 RepID=A0A0H4R1E9_9LACO|nr:hypothetical protein [Companilactobacillus ginsenosidimutans]AKP67550.1 hypothetical protein ABM34_08420 [Companilactobacillus ginsenosidimutans]